MYHFYNNVVQESHKAAYISLVQLLICGSDIVFKLETNFGLTTVRFSKYYWTIIPIQSSWHEQC